MANARFPYCRFAGGLLLVLAWTLALPFSLNGQTTPATTQNSAAAEPQLPAEVQAQLDKLQDALKAAHSADDAKAEAKALNDIGALRYRTSDYGKAQDSYNQALTLARLMKDPQQAAAALNGIAKCYGDQSQNSKALETYQQALDLATASGDLREQATALNGIGVVDYILGQNQKALDLQNKALPLAQRAGDRELEATILRRTGVFYYALGERQKALEYCNQALSIYRQMGDRHGEARTLVIIGHVNLDIGEVQKTLEYYSQALSICRQMGDRDGEAYALTDIGDVYSELGQKQKSLDYLNQALRIFHAVGGHEGEADALIAIGVIYSYLGEKKKALEYYDKALPIFRQVGYADGEAYALSDIGNIYNDFGEKQKALDYLNQALRIFHAVGDPDEKAETLRGIGEVYNTLGNSQEALKYYNQALPLASAVGDPLLEAHVFDNMMLTQKTPQPALAIFYGKRAVNLLEQVRGNIKGLGKELQKSFLASKEDYYHDLADLLIAQGRLPEALQVLDLEKELEYSDYVRGETANTLSPLTLTPAEKQAEEDYRKSTAQLVALGEQWGDLKKIKSRTAEQEKQYQQISDQLDAASKGLNDYYARLYLLFGKNSDANKQMADVKGDVSLLKQTIAKTPHTVALYTLVGKDRASVIVITGTATVAREYAIGEGELNKKVAEFEQVLRDPAKDPKPLAQELYKVLIAPVKEDLDQAQVQTLVWSLDGVLRYVPMAALYDGKHYVVEKYNTVTITPASIAHLAETPDVSSLSAAAMGISRKYEEGLTALPAVVGELNDVVKDAHVQGAHGVLPGTILLNEQFTEKAMEDQLGGLHAVVHIASHFVFKPGDDSQSYLLLAGKDEGGQGFHLTVADFRDNQKLTLDDTDLLTLSACETGMSGNASNGREVDGLGTTAQLKGAKAVISSLWEVDDASTGELMGDFYKRWADGAGKVTKVEALREAQLDLLLGRVTPRAGASGRGMGRARPEHDVAAGYAHPYYWAPFVLMGNWR
jgi:CHAT domain-containing protein/tetratricopeptide (TPR) repeat protein